VKITVARAGYEGLSKIFCKSEVISVLDSLKIISDLIFVNRISDFIKDEKNNVYSRYLLN
jgi:hypothetical protein